MKTTKLILIAITTVTIYACKHKKSITTSATPTTTNTAATPAVAVTPADTIMPKYTYFAPKPMSITYTPGKEELTAIQVKYNDVTLDKLQRGYTLYAESACIGCHRAFDIHKIEEPKWKAIIEDMAQKAHISNEQKDEVYMYVLAVKSTQSK